MDKVIIIGGKGAAVVVGEQIYDAEKKGFPVKFLGYAFDDESFGSSINGHPIHAKTIEVYSKFKDDPEVKFIFQLYRPDLMEERVSLRDSFGIPDHRFFTFIHPMTMVAKSAELGFGTSVLAGTVINANAKIGNHCTLNSNCLIGHDSQLGDSNFLAAHAVIGSNIKIGSLNFFGLNSSYNNYITIGDGNFVAMGSNVVKNLENGQKVMGNPAKLFNTKIKPL